MSAASEIALATNRDERLELFARSYDSYTRDVVWHAWEDFPTGPWTSWESLGGPPTRVIHEKPVVERNSDGRLEVFILGSGDGAVWHCWRRPEGRWSDWESLGRPGGPETNAQYRPALARNHDGRLELFTVARVGTVWHRWQRAEGGWSAWSSLGRPIGEYASGRPAAAQNKDGRLEVFTRASDGAVWHRWQRAEGGWSAWSSLERPIGGYADEKPAVAQNKDGRLEVFTLASDGAVWHCWQRPEGGWSAWESLGSQPDHFTDMAVTAHGNGRLVVFVTVALPSSDDSGLMMRQQVAEDDWSPWRLVGNLTAAPSDPHPGGVPRDLTAALRADGCLQVFVVLQEAGSLYQLMQSSPNSDSWGETAMDLWRIPT